MRKLIERLAARIRDLRKKKGLSQEELAARAGIDYTYLNQIESGIRNPSIKTINQIAQALKIPLWMIFMGMETYAAQPTIEEIRFLGFCKKDKPRKGKTPAWRKKYLS